MTPDNMRDVRRETNYLKHARDEAGDHLPADCPECERVEGLEKDAAALTQVSDNCDALFTGLKALYEQHGGCGCLSCVAASSMIKVVGRLTEMIASGEPPTGGSGDDRPVLRFVKVVSPNGYPVAQFYTRIMSTETEDPNHFLLDRETLAGIVERGRAEGKPSPEHARALQALDEAIRAWAQTPWDGR